jgi:PAS domain S-box-containing protein
MRISKDGVVLFANPGSQPLLNLWGCRVGSKLPAHLQEQIRAMFQTNIPIDGEIACNDQAFSFVFVPSAAAEYVNDYGRGSTASKRAEQALRASEAQLKEAQRLTHIGSSYWDVQTDTTNWSDELYRITGWDPALPGPTRAERAKLYTPESFARINEAITRGITTGEPYDLEVEIVRRDGVRRQARVRGATVYDERGAVIGLSGTLEDITERKQAEVMTRHLAAIVEASGDAIVGTSLDGTIISWNHGAERIYGYATSEAIGQSISLISEPEQHAQLGEIFAQVRQGVPIQSIETTRITKDGRRIDVSMTISPMIDSSGGVIAASGISRDITERKQAERKVLHYNRLLNTLSHTNKMIVRVQGEQELFEEACKIAVEHGSLQMAWVGKVNQTTRLVDPVAVYGDSGNYLAGIRISIDDVPEGQGPTGNALRQGKPFICRDIEHEPYMSLWRDAARKMGFRSSAAFPLQVGNEIIGVYTVYASEVGWFTEDEIQLLEELSYDISHGLEFIEKERQRKQADFALMERLKEMTCLAEIRHAVGQLQVVGELCQQIVENLVPAMQFPELTVAVLDLDGKYYTTDANHQQLTHGLHAPIRVQATKHGTLSIYYTRDEDFLLPYEQDLIDGVAQELSLWLERSRAEVALSASEEKYRLIVETAREGILAFDANWHVTFVNALGAELLGYGRDEMLGKSIDNFVLEVDQAAHHERKAAREQGISGLREGIYRRKDGSTIWLQISATPLMNQGAFAGSFVMLTDISVRKQAEFDRAHQAEQLGRLYRASGALLTDSSFDMSTLARSILTIISNEFEQALCSLFLVEEDSNKLIGIALEDAQTELLNRLELTVDGHGLVPLTIRTNRGLNIGDVQTHASYVCWWDQARSKLTVPLTISSRVIGCIDIQSAQLNAFSADDERLMSIFSERAALALEHARSYAQKVAYAAELERRVEERTAILHQMNAELHHVNRVKDEFLANMSHELRSPLNGILGMAELLLTKIRGPLTEKQEVYIQTITASGQHLLGLINDILDISKIEAGKFDIFPEMIRVNDICQASLSFVKELAVKKAITVTFHPDAANNKLLADPKRLKQILVNLLTNAVKFTPAQGTVLLEVLPVPEQQRIHISVRDTGIGIAPEDLQRLFRPFVQVDSSLTRDQEGTGLGLVLVQRLSEMHGGSISVESEEGKGSCFTVILPWKPDLEAREPDIHPSTESLSPTPFEQPQAKGIVLLAEDNPTNSMVIQDFLESRGYAIVFARNGADALTVLETAGPDIIVMDIQMPVMDGLEAMRHIRSNPKYTSIPIIAVTALAMLGDRERCLAAGANEYLSKPVSLRQLEQAIGDLLAKPRGEQAARN